MPCTFSQNFVIACACIWCQQFLFVNMIHTYNLSLSYSHLQLFLVPPTTWRALYRKFPNLQLRIVSNYIINIKLIEYVIKEHWIPSFVVSILYRFPFQQTWTFVLFQSVSDILSNATVMHCTVDGKIPFENNIMNILWSDDRRFPKSILY